MARSTVTTLLAACVCAGVGVDAFTSGFSSKPMDFLFKGCRGKVGNDAITECLLTHLNIGLAVVRPMFRSGLRVGNSTMVLDPLELDPIRDSSSAPPLWEFSNVRLSGLSSVAIDRLQVTESTIEIEASLPAARIEATVDLWFMPVRPELVVDVQRPRVEMSADWAYVGGDLVFSNSEKIVFLTDGYAVTMNSIDVPKPA